MLLLFAFVSGWLVQRHMADERRLASESIAGERIAAWGELIQRALPPADAASEAQAALLREWSLRLRVPLALDNAAGQRIGESDSFARRSAEGVVTPLPIKLDDGRTLWTMRPGALLRQMANGGGADARAVEGRAEGERASRGGEAVPGGRGFGERGRQPPPLWPWVPPSWPAGTGLVIVLVVLFIAVAAGAFPVVRRLTLRLEALQKGVERFGAGELGQRVAVSGKDEVAAVAASFNVAAARIEALVQSHRSLLANASHELRSPLARMKMAVSMLEDATPERREKLKAEIDRNIGELDELVEEVLLASRLDRVDEPLRREPVDLVALAAEEAGRVGAALEAPAALSVGGDERLLRRALRNLLENAQRYGGGDVEVALRAAGGAAEIEVGDRGPGVPAPLRERIFEPFYRLPGHAEQAGGVGLGLSLVKQIAERHAGRVRVADRHGGGSLFTIVVPAA